MAELSSLRFVDPNANLDTIGRPTALDPNDFPNAPEITAQSIAPVQGDFTDRVQNASDFVSFAVPSLLVGAVDTFGQSIGILEDDELVDYLKNTGNLNRFTDYYEANRESYQLAADLGSMFIPGLAAVKLIQGTGWLAKALKVKQNPLLKNIFTRMRDRNVLDRKIQQLYSHHARVGNTVGFDNIKLADGRKFSTALKAGAAIDGVKKGIAWELGVFATMNESEILYPSEWELTSHLAFAALGIALPAGTETLFARSLLKRQLSGAGVLAQKALNPEGFPADEVLLRQHETGFSVFAGWLAANKRAGIDSNLDQELRANHKRLEVEIEGVLKKEIPKGPLRNTTQGLIPKVKGTDATTDALMVGLEKDWAIAFGYKAHTIFPQGPDGIAKLMETGKKLSDKARTKSEEIIAKGISEMGEAASMMKAEGVDTAKIMFEAEQQMAIARDLDQFQFFVQEPTGEFTTALGRKVRWTDILGNKVQKQARTKLEPAVFFAADVTTPGLGGTPRRIGFDELGYVRIQPLETDARAETRFTVKAMDDIALEEYRKSSFNLFDIGKTFSPTGPGSMGKGIFESLPMEIRNEIENWVGDPDMSKIRKWFENNDEQARILYDAYEPLRLRLHELADEDGTVQFLRGEKISSFLKPHGDIVSMTSSIKIGKQFAQGSGKQTIKRHTPVEDVIMVVGGQNEWEYIVKNNKIREASVRITRETSENFNSLLVHDKSAVFASMQASAENFKIGGQKITLNENDHWTRLEWAMEVRRIHGDKVLNSFQLPKAWADNWKHLEFAAVRSKFDDWSVLMDVKERVGKVKIKPEQAMNMSDVHYGVNLPASYFDTPHPLEQLFMGLRAQGSKSLDLKSIEDVQHFVKQNAHWKGPDGFDFSKEETLRLSGNNFRLGKDRNGNRLIPILMVKNDMSTIDFTKTALFDQAVARRMEVITELSELAGDVSARLVSEIAEIVNSLSATVQARRVEELVGGQVLNLSGATTGRHATRFSPTIQAAHDIETAVTKIVTRFKSELYARHSPLFNRIRAGGNKVHLETWGMYVSARRFGWHLDAEPIANANGTFSFKLSEKNSFNTRKWRQLFGEDVPEDAMMPVVVKGKPQQLAITDMALETAEAFVDMGNTLLTNGNVVRRLAGFNELNRRDWWVPPKNFQKNNVAYIIRPAEEGGEPLKLMITADNPLQLQNKLESKAVREVVEANPGTMVVKQEEVQRYYNLQDQAFHNMIDFAEPAAQTAAGRGASASPILELGRESLDELASSINKQLTATARKTTNLMFESEINFARLTSHASGSVEPFKNFRTTNTWNTYVQTLLGTQTLDPEGVIGKAYYTIESYYDNVLAALYDKHLRNPSKALVRSLKGGNEKRFKELQDKLGEYNPFQNSVEFAEAQFNIAVPSTMRSHMATFNFVTSSLTLRMFELGHAILNFSGLLATHPAVLNSLNRIAGETREDWIKRIGAYGSPVGDRDVAIPNYWRMATGTMSDMFTPQGMADLKFAQAKGYGDQHVAEIFATMVAPQEGFAAGILRKGVDVVSVVSDKSEKWTRLFAHMMGVNIARKGLKMENADDIHIFAHRFANDNIGDYRSNNRPQLFQGAVGMPLGLFQTYVWNYYQRIFGYIENKQIRALAVGEAMQASVFGMKSVPGWREYNAMYTDAMDDQQNAVDAIQNRYGRDMADLILYGSISNIPKIWGPDGMALYTRGDLSDVRLPTPFGFDRTAPYRLASNTVGIVNDTIGQFLDGGQYSHQQQMEIIAKYSINRPLRHVFEIAAGYSVDRRGQVVSRDTRSAMSVSARILAFKPLQEAKQVEAYYTSRQAEFSQMEKRQRLNLGTRALFRSGEVDAKDFRNILRDYIESGGSVDYFGTWLKNSLLIAKATRTERKFLEALKAKELIDTIRMINAGIFPRLVETLDELEE